MSVFACVFDGAFVCVCACMCVCVCGCVRVYVRAWLGECGWCVRACVGVCCFRVEPMLDCVCV